MKKTTSTACLALLLTALANGSPALADSHGEGHGMKPMAAEMKHSVTMATGVIKEVASAERKLKIYHQPIDAWNMGAMQMTFQLAPNVDIDSIKVGMGIRFLVSNPAVGQYQIIEIVEQL